MKNIRNAACIKVVAVLLLVAFFGMSAGGELVLTRAHALETGIRLSDSAELGEEDQSELGTGERILEELRTNDRLHSILKGVALIAVANYLINRAEQGVAASPQEVLDIPAEFEEDILHSQKHPEEEYTSDERKLIELINEERSQNGLEALEIDRRLVHLARIKSNDMINNGYFAHYSPIYGSPREMLQAFGMPFSKAGENIARGSNAEDIHQALMESEAHRANILREDFTHMGVGVIHDGPSKLTVTQYFVNIPDNNHF